MVVYTYSLICYLLRSIQSHIPLNILYTLYTSIYGDYHELLAPVSYSRAAYRASACFRAKARLMRVTSWQEVKQT